MGGGLDIDGGFWGPFFCTYLLPDDEQGEEGLVASSCC